MIAWLLDASVHSQDTGHADYSHAWSGEQRHGKVDGGQVYSVGQVSNDDCLSEQHSVDTRFDQESPRGATRCEPSPVLSGAAADPPEPSSRRRGVRRAATPE